MLALALCLPANGFAADPAPTAQADKPAKGGSAPVASAEALVDGIELPYDKFVLDNGLTAIVHTDRKAPVVGVTLYYRIGSKHEPRGRTGFAHLYEHLFFYGSANAPEFFGALEAAGVTDTNGSTWFDRTNYLETVPTGALDLALFLESDRMGYILPAITQDRLDKQRGVVQNEKRQNDNQPYGLFYYALGEGLFPVGHPYRHSTIGSMADLDAASLTDVRKWFTDHYGPNNVVLVLSGDIDTATAKSKVEKWFGDIPRGPDVKPVEAGPVTLAAPKEREMTDRVPVTRITRNWSGPGLNHPQTPALQIGMRILGGLASSRLDNELVRGQEVAVAVTASTLDFEQVNIMTASMDVKPGVDRAAAEAAFDKVIADYIAQGPTEDEVRRAVVSTISSTIGGLEQVGSFGGKGDVLAEGEIYSDDPLKFKKDLAAMAALTPADVKQALSAWLSRPVYELSIVPGERTEDGATMGGWGDEGQMAAPAPDTKAPVAQLAPAPKREAPAVQPVADLTFPAVEHAKLANGMEVSLARRTSIPKVIVSIAFDAGYAADALDTPGTQGMMLRALDEGTTSRDATQIAIDQERLGANISSGASEDESFVRLSALSENLAPSLALMADVVLNPAYNEADVARVKQQSLAALGQRLAQPVGLGLRVMGSELYGDHPYAQPSDGLGTADSLAALTPADLKAAHGKWLRADNAHITVVGDITMDELLPKLNAAFGKWKSNRMARPVKAIDAAVPQQGTRVVVVDRPNSPQSVIFGGHVLPITGRTADTEATDLAANVMGDSLLSRLSADLRETKGWSYGAYTLVTRPAGPRALAIYAPVQADKTGDSLKAVLGHLAAYPGEKPTTEAEHQRVTDGAIRALPDQFQTNGAVLGAIERNELLDRPENYYETLPATYRGIDAAEIDAAAKTALDASDMVFVIVGDRKTIEPQLEGIGLPVEYREAPSATPTAQ